jgi:hypothetical protein
MGSNFIFLSKKWRELFEVVRQAEKAVQTDPNAALIKLRLFGELIVKQIFAYESVYEPYRMSQKERIDLLLKEGIITPEVHELLDSMRLIGNKAVHEVNYGSSSEATRLLMAAFQLGGWLTQVYKKWDFHLPAYKEPEPEPDKVVTSVTRKDTATQSDKSMMIDTYRESSNLITADIIRFSNQEAGYEQWLQDNKNGFVFNHYGGTNASKDMNKIHHACCRFLHRIQDEGKRTTAYPKICSSDLRELESHVVTLRGDSWVYCKSCHI